MHRRTFVSSILASLLPLETGRSGALVFCCSATNDLYHGLAAAGRRFPRFATPAEAIAHAAPEAGVLLLADGYPAQGVALDADLRAQALRRRLRLYLEYPAWLLPPTGAPRQAHWERAVVTSDFFGAALAPLRLLTLHDCQFLVAPALRDGEHAHLVLAKVAGFDTAVYGLADTETVPLLIEDPAAQTLLATTQLSQFVTARYAPVQDWTTIWAAILGWLLRGAPRQGMRFTPSVRPAYGAAEPLPPHAERDGFERGVGWYRRSKLLIHPSWADQQVGLACQYWDAGATGPGPAADWPGGDGRHGVLEGFASRLRSDGSQYVKWMVRADCVGETAMVHALGYAVTHREPDRQAAANLVDYLLTRSPMSLGPHADPANPAYGLIGWNNIPKYPASDVGGLGVYYGDDNARCLLGLVTTARLLGETQWDERIWLAVLANFRLMGQTGFRESRHDAGPLTQHGWRFYYDSAGMNTDMNYQASCWSLFLWAYAVTGYRPFLERTKTGIRLTMEAYPNWQISESMALELARLLMTLAWLVRVDDTPDTRGWLRRVAGALLAHQDASGAIGEWIGAGGSGVQMPPGSNAAYGSAEGPLIQRDGDPAADLLYTVNFAAMGFQEAAAATGDAVYRTAADKVREFCVRVQVHSERHPELHGAWFRGFDFRRWEYWASSTDVGWGVWSTETGWIQSWITTVLGLRLLHRSLWDVIAGGTSDRAAVFDRLRKQMVPDSA